MTKSDPFEQGLAAGEAAASASGDASQSTSSNGGRMYVRTQSFGSTDAELRFLQRCGVRHKAVIRSMTAADGTSTNWSRYGNTTSGLGSRWI